MPRETQDNKYRKHALSPAEMMAQVKLDIERAKLAKLQSTLPKNITAEKAVHETPPPTTFENMIPPTDAEVDHMQIKLNALFYERVADALSADNLDMEHLAALGEAMHGR